MATYTLVATATGSAGSAGVTVTTDYTVRGFLDGIMVTYSSAPATTDTTVSGVGGLAQTILTLTNTNTSFTSPRYPLRASHDSTGVVVGYDRFYMDGKLRVVVAQADNGTVVTVMIRIIESNGEL